MSIWDYLGEFLLFRWLFGKLNRNHRAHNTDSADTIDYTHIHSKEYVTFRTIDQQLSSRSLYCGADIYDDDDALDDYNPTDSDDCALNDFINDCDNRDYGYSQSYDEFHDEQDDYDMMDDDF